MTSPAFFRVVLRTHSPLHRAASWPHTLLGYLSEEEMAAWTSRSPSLSCGTRANDQRTADGARETVEGARQPPPARGVRRGRRRTPPSVETFARRGRCATGSSRRAMRSPTSPRRRSQPRGRTTLCALHSLAALANAKRSFPRALPPPHTLGSVAGKSRADSRCRVLRPFLRHDELLGIYPRGGSTESVRRRGVEPLRQASLMGGLGMRNAWRHTRHLRSARPVLLT